MCHGHTIDITLSHEEGETVKYERVPKLYVMLNHCFILFFIFYFFFFFIKTNKSF